MSTYEVWMVGSDDPLEIEADNISAPSGERGSLELYAMLQRPMPDVSGNQVMPSHRIVTEVFAAGHWRRCRRKMLTNGLLSPVELD